MEEDRYIRITLRIPRELHAELSAAAEETSKSLNAEIVARLQSTEKWRVDAEKATWHAERLSTELAQMSKSLANTHQRLESAQGEASRMRSRIDRQSTDAPALDLAYVLAKLQLQIVNLQFDLRRIVLEGSHLKNLFERILFDHPDAVRKTIGEEGLATAAESLDRIGKALAETENADAVIPRLHQRQAELLAAETAFHAARDR